MRTADVAIERLVQSRIDLLLAPLSIALGLPVRADEALEVRWTLIMERVRDLRRCETLHEPHTYEQFVMANEPEHGRAWSAILEEIETTLPPAYGVPGDGPLRAQLCEIRAEMDAKVRSGDNDPRAQQALALIDRIDHLTGYGPRRWRSTRYPFELHLECEHYLPDTPADVDHCKRCGMTLATLSGRGPSEPSRLVCVQCDPDVLDYDGEPYEPWGPGEADSPFAEMGDDEPG